MIDKLPRKEFEFKDYAVDIFVIESFPSYTQIQAILRPLRLTINQDIGVVYKGRVYPLVLNKDSMFAITLAGVSFPADETRQVQLPVVKELLYIETPVKHLSDDLSWDIKRNQFGVYVYLAANDDAVEKFVSILIEKYKLRVINWGVNNDQIEFSWRIKLSSGLSISTVRAAVKELVTQLTTVLKAPGPLAAERKAVRESKVFEVKKPPEENDFSAELIEKESELRYVYQEIDKLTLDNQKQAEIIDELINSSQVSVSLAQKVRRGAAEKLLANAIFVAFPNLAFAPEVIDELKTRFKDSKSIWYVLKKLDEGEGFPLTKLNNLAGKLGWHELKKHINTGADDRGRIYCRRSCKKHEFDVILHWKKNDKDQQKVFRKLASYEPFASTETIYM